MNETRGLWRGKRTDNGEWVDGFLVKMWGTVHLQDKEDENLAVPVDPETLGECTGLRDKNGKLIFEGDIIKFREWRKGLWCWIGTVRYVNQGFVVSGNPNEECDTPFTVSMSRFASKSVEIIGNIHDNPELLKQEERDGNNP